MKVGLGDSGVDVSSLEFTLGQFTAGESGTRELTFGNDQTAPACSHGTRMAGIIAAGKNGHSVVGVAWASHFYTYRHGNSIAADPNSVIDGIRAAGNWGARVIEMAFGTIDTSARCWDVVGMLAHEFTVDSVPCLGTWGPGGIVCQP